MDSFRQGILMQVEELGLHRLGEVFHEFPNRAFTAVICLTESHISVHTWPEFQRVTFDVFLSNFEHVNDDKAASLAHWIQMFFDGEIAQRKEVYR
jgi:S-adenosylmethionine decarboxylase